MKPSKVLVLPEALRYPHTEEIIARLKAGQIPVEILSSNRVPGTSNKDAQEDFFAAKRTLVLAVRKKAEFQSCKPSANYQYPLVSGCPGHCQYCYLNTSFGPKPYIRIYVNLEEIQHWADEVMGTSRPFVTIWEGAATSDPVAVEPWSGSLYKTIEFFGQHPYGRFRFVTKFDQIDSLLDADHNNHTRIRFTVNTETVINNWDKGTTSLKRRILAAQKVAQAGYLYGFLIGPIMVYDGWKEEYAQLIHRLASELPETLHKNASLELITHRFTPRAKELIEKVYPDTTLDMNERNRKWKHGQFGYGKWVYPQEIYKNVQDHLFEVIRNSMPDAHIMYLV